MKKIIDAMDKGIGMLEKIVLFGSITVMLIVTAIEVLDAKVLHANLMWTTEVNRIMLVWCILSGASVAAGTRSHLGVEFLVRKMPKKIAKWVVLFTDLICIFVSGYVVASGIALVSMQIRLGSVYSITRWPTAVGELAVPVCFALVLIRILFTIYHDFTKKDEGGGWLRNVNHAVGFVPGDDVPGKRPLRFPYPLRPL